MSVKIERLESTQTSAWDAYVHAHSKATLYHLSGWESVVEKTYGHKTYYLVATKSPSEPETDILWKSIKPTIQKRQIIGILPLVHIKHFLFGNSLISMPFFDLGGVLADDEETEKALVCEAIKLGQELRVKGLELRQTDPFSCLNMEGSEGAPKECIISGIRCSFHRDSNKAMMLLDLPQSSEVLMKSFKAKLRSQIKRPKKEGLKTKIGGLELINDFYKVFSVNMRDLGSPVHSMKLMRNVIRAFEASARIVVVYMNDDPLASSIVVGFKGVLENPWASALREYSRLSPNMLLYWAMLEYACDNGYDFFDFGRSTPGGGTYKFKEQWGAKPRTLNWEYISLNGQPRIEASSVKSKFDKAIQYWQKLPVPLTKIIGPMFRKHIGL